MSVRGGDTPLAVTGVFEHFPQESRKNKYLTTRLIVRGGSSHRLSLTYVAIVKSLTHFFFFHKLVK